MSVILLQVKMAQKRNIVEVPDSVNYASSDQQRQWYLDIWGLEGSMFNKIRLFVADMGSDTFQDLGPITSSSISVVDSHPSTQCINIGIRGNLDYQLDPKAYVIEKMMRDKEDTMFSRGWKLESASQDITIQELQDSIAYCVKGKKVKDKKPPKSQPQKKAKTTTGVIDVDEVIARSGTEKESPELTAKIRFVDPKALENEAQKALKSDTGGMEKYSKYFPFKYKEYEIPVDQCWLAPDHYNSRGIEHNRIDECMLFFAASANRPGTCAYLMPVKNAGKKKGDPMKLGEIVEEKLTTYSYWIIDGQHSIYAAKFLRRQEMEEGGQSQQLVEVYAKRKARIVVDPEPEVATAISAIANEEAQSLYVKQPYNDILQHLRSQWVFNNSPSKPTTGVIEGSPSRKDWDVSIYPSSIIFICKK